MSTEHPEVTAVPIFEASKLPAFQGYEISQDGTILITKAVGCETDKTFVYSGTYGQCCDTARAMCGIATACVTGVIQYNNGNTYQCQGHHSCGTMTIREAPGKAGGSSTNIFCGIGWHVHTVFRALEESSSTVVESFVQTTATTGPPTTSSSVSETDDATGSQAWIAAAVIVPIVLISGIVFAIWFLRRRAAQKKGTAAGYPKGDPATVGSVQGMWPQNQYQKIGRGEQAGVYEAPVYGQQYDAYMGHYTTGKSTPSVATPPPHVLSAELPEDNAHHEMDGRGTPDPVAELPGEQDARPR